MRRPLNMHDRHGSVFSVGATTGPVLVASDGTAASAPAFVMAHELAARAGAAVEVVSALEPTNPLVPPIEPPPHEIPRGATRAEDRGARLLELVRRAHDEGPPWPIEIALGERVATLAHAARARGASLIVTGRAPHGAVERVVRHETPIALARAARVPVLAVPLSAPRLPRCIVVAVGLGDAGVRAGAVADLLFRDAVAVHLVHVTAPSPPRRERALREEAEDDADVVRHAVERASAGWHLPADVAVVSHVVAGQPLPALLDFAETVGADLVVAGLPEGTAIPLSRRPLAAALYRQSPRALLLVPLDDDGRRQLPRDTSASADRAEWPRMLDRVRRRNLHRTATLAADDRLAGARVLARRMPLVGVSYEPHAHAVAVTLGDPASPASQQSHRVAHPLAIAVHRDGHGREDALVVEYDGGQVLLTFE